MNAATTICVVGAGPRGISVVERVCANADYMGLLTTGRGGEFARKADGTLSYRRSGREPVLYAGSRRGTRSRAR